VLSSWHRFAPACPSCGLRLDRGEEDYFLGAYLFNLVAAELIFAIAFVAVLLATWPTPPWTLLEYGGALLAVLAPIGFYPFSKLLWLAFDLLLRPLTPEELEWHREGSDDLSRSLPQR
jgi:Protein of unknown function (DUF983)